METFKLNARTLLEMIVTISIRYDSISYSDSKLTEKYK